MQTLYQMNIGKCESTSMVANCRAAIGGKMVLVTEETIPMKAIVVTDQAAGTAEMKLVG